MMVTEMCLADGIPDGFDPKTNAEAFVTPEEAFNIVAQDLERWHYMCTEQFCRTFCFRLGMY